VPVKRVQSFEFYGADVGWRVPMGEGTVKGGIPGPYYTSLCLPICSHVTGGLMVSIAGLYVEGPRFESQPSHKKIRYKVEKRNFEILKWE
jgi:hypothetical protein